MPPRIQQHVGDRIAHLPRAGEHLVVIPVGQHLPGAPAPDRPVDREREQPRQPLHPAPERRDAVGLDDQVRVIVLDRVVHEPEVRSRARAPERPLHLANDLPLAQRRNVAPHRQRDVAGIRGRELVAAAMPQLRPRPARPPRVLALPAVLARVEVERRLSRSPSSPLPSEHHDRHGTGDRSICQARRTENLPTATAPEATDLEPSPSKASESRARPKRARTNPRKPARARGRRSRTLAIQSLPSAAPARSKRARTQRNAPHPTPASASRSPNRRSTASARPGLRRSVGVLAHQRQRGLASGRDEARVAQEVGDAEVRQAAVLARAEELARAADARGRLRRCGSRPSVSSSAREPRLAVLGAAARDEQAGAAPRAAADAAAQLVELREAEALGVLDHHQRRVRRRRRRPRSPSSRPARCVSPASKRAIDGLARGGVIRPCTRSTRDVRRAPRRCAPRDSRRGAQVELLRLLDERVDDVRLLAARERRRGAARSTSRALARRAAASVTIGVRPGGSSSSTRHVEVAVDASARACAGSASRSSRAVRMRAAAPCPRSAARWSTPKRCCSSTTTSASRAKPTSPWRSACVPTSEVELAGARARAQLGARARAARTR